jgi:aspartate aminotransferase-like enzyme
MSLPNEMPRPAQYRLRLPGPTAVPERIRLATAAAMVNHRGPEFHALFDEAVRRVRPVLGTTGEVLLFPGSGTGVMEAAIANLVAPGDPVLVVIHGQFGERFKAIAEGMGAAVDTVESEWGDPPDAERVAAAARARDYRAVFVTHNESSTGAVADLAAIGKALAGGPAVLVVDAVSSAAGLPLRQDEWGLDVVVTASQKALMCPPGLGLVSVSEKAWRAMEREGGTPRFYWDFRRARAAFAKSETAFTAPVSLVAGLVEALRMIDEEGLPAVFERHWRCGEAMRAGGTALGLEIFTRGGTLSDTVTVFRAPGPIEGGAIVRRLYEAYHTVIAGARNRLQGKVFRIGTMGAIDAPDILTDLHYLECALRDLGMRVPQGAGVAAAAKILG